MDVLLTKTVAVPTRLAVLLGHTVGVALRLKPKKQGNVPEGKPLIEAKRVRRASILP